MRIGILGTAVLLFAIGCGGGSDGGGPSVYTLVPNAGFSVRSGDCTDVAGPFRVPGGASMAFRITDTPSGIGNDSMEAGIMSDSLFLAANGCDFNQAIADVSFTGSYASSASPAVAPDDYTFIVGCSNIVDTCFFNLTWTATY